MGFSSRMSRRRFVQGTAASAAVIGCQIPALGQVRRDPGFNRLCIDVPVIPAGMSEERAAEVSPVAAAVLEADGKLQVEEVLTPGVGGGGAGGAAAPSGAARAMSGGPARAVLDAPRDKGTQARALGPAKAAYLKSWEVGKRLRVKFDGGTNELHDRVLAIAREWTQFANIDFVPDTSSASEIIVGFKSRLGNWSAVGPDSLASQFRSQSMNLELAGVSDRDFRFLVLHEFGHALGCVHEHLSPSSPLRFRQDAAFFEYFRLRGLNRQEVFTNIINRYAGTQLLRYSDFDPKSIMLYQFPSSLTADGRGTEQNYELSYTDKKFAIELYPGRMRVDEIPRVDTTSGNGGGGGGSATVKQLSLDGARVEANISARGGEAVFEFTIPSDRSGKFHTIGTEGTTQVALRLFGPDDASREIVPRKGEEEGTPDLVNHVLRLQLNAGKYVVRAAHFSKDGGGPFKVYLERDKKDILLGTR